MFSPQHAPFGRHPTRLLGAIQQACHTTFRYPLVYLVQSSVESVGFWLRFGAKLSGKPKLLYYILLTAYYLLLTTYYLLLTTDY
jgi:hypothetical protein